MMVFICGRYIASLYVQQQQYTIGTNVTCFFVHLHSHASDFRHFFQLHLDYQRSIKNRWEQQEGELESEARQILANY